MSLEKHYKHNPKLATVIVTEHSGTLIKMPNGDILPGIIMTRVTDHIDEHPYVIVKMHCNLGFTEPKEAKPIVFDDVWPPKCDPSSYS